MAKSGIPTWKNIDPSNPSLEDLALIIRQMLDYLDAIDARLTAGGL